MKGEDGVPGFLTLESCLHILNAPMGSLSFVKSFV